MFLGEQELFVDKTPNVFFPTMHVWDVILKGCYTNVIFGLLRGSSSLHRLVCFHRIRYLDAEYVRARYPLGKDGPRVGRFVHGAERE